MKNFLQRFKDSDGSVLMEFVIILPAYLAVIGGILSVGTKSLDAINLRSADHWAVWSAGNRFRIRTPALLALRDMFPRATLITASQKRALAEKNSYLQLVGSKTVIYQKNFELFENLANAPYTIYGEKPFRIPDLYMTSSRWNNPYTQCIIMRTKGSGKSKRTWDSSIIADKNIWKFEASEDKYPKKWEVKLLDEAKHTDDDFKTDKEPKKKKFYERFRAYEEWSAK